MRAKRDIAAVRAATAEARSAAEAVRADGRNAEAAAARADGRRRTGRGATHLFDAGEREAEAGAWGATVRAKHDGVAAARAEAATPLRNAPAADAEASGARADFRGAKAAGARDADTAGVVGAEAGAAEARGSTGSAGSRDDRDASRGAAAGSAAEVPNN